MAESPSALLERAAALIEHIADEAPPPPWREHGLDGAIHAKDPSTGGHEVVASRTRWGASRWIETMSPAVAAPLVNWLRDTADDLRVGPAQTSSEDYALKFAQLILGEAVDRD